MGARFVGPIPMRADSFLRPVTLTGRYVELVPLEPRHVVDLWRLATDPEVTQYLRAGPVQNPADLERQVADQLAGQANGTDLPFATCLLPSRRPVGMTRFLRIDRPNQWVEIGGTWLSPALWRTPLNTEAKLLMLRHAFEVEHAHRVQFQTDLRNERSQRAIARLGAQREGVLREDVVMPDGYRRSSVYFSVLEAEWPGVRARLEAMLVPRWTPPA
jgi:N-acetyltransferase